MGRKQAVVYVLDANSSMNQPCSKTVEEDVKSSAAKSRLECGKKALKSMVADLMLQSKQNEASVIITKTKETSHHKIAAGVDLEVEYGDDLPFPNLTEYPESGMSRPTIGLLRSIEAIQTEVDTSSYQGDIVEALILAADAMHERTHKYKFVRKIVLITDAGHDIVLDVDQTLVIIDSLRDMECTLEILGIDFDSEGAVYSEPAAAPDNVVSSSATADQVHSSKADENAMESEDTEGGPQIYSDKADREALLLSLAEKTGGRVSSVSSLQEILDTNKGKRIPATMQYKFELRIAPGLTIQARKFNLFSATNLPTLKKEVVLQSEDGEAQVDEEGKEATSVYIKKALWVDEEKPDDNISNEDQTTALPFGSTLVPMSEYDFEGVFGFTKEQPWLEIIGYMHRGNIPSKYISGPPIGIAGHESDKACAAIAALAQALYRTGKVAIGTFLKTTASSFPRLTAVFPLEEDRPVHLVALQIPYEDEIIGNLSKSGFPEPNAEKIDACNKLVRSLMLPSGVLDSGSVPNPSLRSWHQTVLEKALNHEAPIVKSKLEATPDDVVENAKEALAEFSNLFPFTMKEKSVMKPATKTGRKTATYSDML